MQATKGNVSAKPYAIDAARPRPVASRNTALSARVIVGSIEIREVAHHLDEHAREPVHEVVVAGVDQDIGLSSDAHATQSLLLGGIELDGDREALRLTQPIPAVLDLRQRAGLRLLAGSYAGAYAAHASLQHLARHHVENDRGGV